jgi:threonylcarbamoyladenosine tRNA methylthiotransferase MtaB
MGDQVPVQLARERNRVLRELAATKKQEFLRSFVGRQLELLTLPRFDGARTEALSDNYLRVMVAGAHPANSDMTVLVDGVEADNLRGHV